MLNSRGSVQLPRVPQCGQVTSSRPERRTPLPGLVLLEQVVGAEPLVAGGALGQRVAERPDMARGHPHLARQDHRGIEPDDVLTAGDHRPPPLLLDVLLQLDPERPVVPGRAGTAIDLSGREHESPPLAEADHFVETACRSHVPELQTRIIAPSPAGTESALRLSPDRHAAGEAAALSRLAAESADVDRAPAGRAVGSRRSVPAGRSHGRPSVRCGRAIMSLSRHADDQRE